MTQQRLTIPVKTVRRPTGQIRQAHAYAHPAGTGWTEPTPTRAPGPTQTTAAQRSAMRIAMEVHAEIEVMCSRFPKPAPIVVPASGLCHKPIEETFQGHLLQYWCVRAPGHAGNCSGKRAQLLAAAPEDVQLDVDHQDAWGCLDAPVTA
ncbi:MAG TPA: hypothetical protein VK735_32550 [Pseudonocardia sp.]|uniref:hypothetical protein n=1 Tax=Pseudonocardia sp. TaxID=60912 RepID=UPI002C6DFB88|nr:hypothetical protein [Pseudonocardia sp.]HTF52199.1 hypothetical protein [Pseudonocardia sp.]